MKKYLLKIIPLITISLITFAAILYMLYQLILSGNPLAAPLMFCIGVFSLCQLLIYRCNPTYTSNPESNAAAQECSSTYAALDTSTTESIEETVTIEKNISEITETLPAENPTNTISDKISLFSNNKPLIEMDIISAVKDAMESLSPFAEAQNIKLHLSTTNDTLMIMAEPESIRILFRNIIDNSIKYMGRAGHMIITISLLGDDIFIILKDTGKGLSEDETTHVFELNFQGSNRVSGNGLGLTQTKMIVEAFGGTIYAKSSLENGMAIYIQLPVSGKHD